MSFSPSPVELWHARASRDTAGTLEQYCEQFLQPEETVNANRFRVASARNQHVIGRAMARLLLAGDLFPPDQVRFKQLDQGKPVVQTPLELARPFNIAHTSGLVLCGLCPQDATDPWLGVDVEAIDRRTDPALAHRYFAAEEIDQLGAIKNDDDRRWLFLKIWTLKEAFIKAIGTGMRTPLDQFAFVNADASHPELTFHNPDLASGRTWQCHSFEPLPGFIAAVALGRQTSTPTETIFPQLSIQTQEFCHPDNVIGRVTERRGTD